MNRQDFEMAINSYRKELEKCEPYSTYWWYVKGALTAIQTYYKAYFKTAKKSYLTELLSKS